MSDCSAQHQRPCHFNRGRHGHVWICVACGKQIEGPKLAIDEIEALIAFAALVTSEVDKRKQTVREDKGDKMETTQLTLTFEGSPSPAVIAAKLRFQAGLLEGMDPKKAANRKNTDAAEAAPLEAEAAPLEEDETIEETDDEFASKKKSSKKKASVDFGTEDEEDTAEEPVEDEAEEEPPPPKKKAKAPTLDDVNRACKAYSKENGFDETKALLQKKFKTSSVTKLKPEQYAQVIAVMSV